MRQFITNNLNTINKPEKQPPRFFLPFVFSIPDSPLLCFIYDFSANNCLQGADIFYFFFRAFHIVTVDHNKICQVFPARYCLLTALQMLRRPPNLYKSAVLPPGSLLPVDAILLPVLNAHLFLLPHNTCLKMDCSFLPVNPFRLVKDFPGRSMFSMHMHLLCALLPDVHLLHF